MKNEDFTLKAAMDFLEIKSRITMRKYADNGDIPSRWVSTRSGRWRVFKKTDLVSFKQKMNKNPGNGFSYLPLGRSTRTKNKPK